MLSATILGLNVYAEPVFSMSSEESENILNEYENNEAKYIQIDGGLKTDLNVSNVYIESDNLISYQWIQTEGASEDNLSDSTPFKINISEEETLHKESEVVLAFHDLSKNENFAYFVLSYDSSKEKFQSTEVTEETYQNNTFNKEIIINIGNNVLDDSLKAEVEDTLKVDIHNITMPSDIEFDEKLNDSEPGAILSDSKSEEIVLDNDGLESSEHMIQDGSDQSDEELDNNDSKTTAADEDIEVAENVTKVVEVEDKINMEEETKVDIDKEKSSLNLVTTSSSVSSRLNSFTTPASAITGNSYDLSANSSSNQDSLFKFWIRDDQTNEWFVLKDYGSNPTYNWQPDKSGEFRLVVHVKHKSSGKEYDDYKFVDLNVEQQRFAIDDFSINGEGIVGKPFALNTSVLGATEELYKYWIQDVQTGTWEVLREYSASSDHNWIPKNAGRYKVVVHSKERMSSNRYDDYTYKYVNINEPSATITGFRVEGLGHAGLTYTMKSEANSTNGTLFKYWVHDLSNGEWEAISDFTTKSEMNWTPQTSGRYQLVVHMKDEYSNKKYDDYTFQYVTVKEPIVKISDFSLTGEKTAGSKFFLNAKVTGSDNALYKYWVQSHITKKWEVIKDFDGESKSSWTPTTPGKYKLVIHSKDSSSQLEYDDYTYKYVDIAAASSEIKEFVVDEAQFAGSDYYLTTDAIADNSPKYKYWIKDFSTNEWKVIREWSNETQIKWTPSKPGKYRLVVHNKDAFSQKEYDDVSYKDVVVHAPFVYETTQYDISLTEALNKQMKYSPQTDLYGGGFKNAKSEDVAYYLNPEHFLDKSLNLSETEPKKVKITADVLNVRSGASTNYSVISSVRKDQLYDVVSEQYGWYKINLGTYTGWISGKYVTVINNEKLINNVKMYGRVNTTTLNVRSGPSTDYRVVDQVYNNESLSILDESNGWYLLSLDGGQGWASGDFLKVSSNIPESMLQFLSLSNSSGISRDVMNAELTGKGILENKGHVFLEASKKYNVNEIYLLSHALLETGNGSSRLATGVEVSEVDGKPVTPKKVYNMFGIAAFDNSPLKSGSEYAYKQGWDTPEKAIMGGAEWIASRYVNNPSHRQDTLYKMRWNPTNPTAHQYATDIGWAVKQTHTLDFLVEISLRNNLVLKFDIPIYN